MLCMRYITHKSMYFHHMLVWAIMGWMVVGANAYAAQEAVLTSGKVVQVINGKNFTLATGKTVRLASIQVPNKARSSDEKDEPQSHEAFKALQQQLEGKTVQLESIDSAEDRHGRMIAWVYDEQGAFVQCEILKRGMGWVYSFFDSADKAKELLACEAEAEKSKLGVWGEPNYAVLDADHAESAISQFRLVQGTVKKVEDHVNTVYINFGEDWKTDFTIIVDLKDTEHFATGWLHNLEGKKVRVRGWVFDKNGPAIELTHPEQLEIQS